MIDFARLAPATPAMLELIEGPKRTGPGTVAPLPMRQRLERLSQAGANGGLGYGEAALERELFAVRSAPNGERNHRVNAAAFAAYQLVHAGLLDRTTTEDRLFAEASAIGLPEAEILRTLESAEEGALKNPRGASRLPSERSAFVPSRTANAQLAPDDEEPAAAGDPLYELLASKVLTTSAMLTREPPAPLIGDILYRNTLAALYGHPGSMKSFLALDWTLSLAKDTLWKRRAVHHGASALYVAAEGVAGIGPRVRAWLRSNKPDMAVEDYIAAYPMANLAWYPEAMALLRPEWTEALAAYAAETKPDLIVIDTLSRSMSGGDENDSVDMTTIVGHMDLVRQAAGSTVLLVHHSPKVGGGLRGHSSLHGACDTEIELKRDGTHLTVHCAKQKDAEAFADINLWWRPVEGVPSIVLTDEAQDVDNDKVVRDGEAVYSKLYSAFRYTGATKAVIAEACGLAEREVLEAVNWLLGERRIDPQGTGWKARERGRS